MTNYQKVSFNNKLDQSFTSELKESVQSYFSSRNITPFANRAMVIKTIVLFTWAITTYALWVFVADSFWMRTASVFALGVAIAGIGFAVQHDANHGAYSEKPWVNRLLGFSINLVGGNDYMWKIKHNIFHHTYTNIYGKDEDIAVASFLRLSPHAEYKPVHRFQPILAWIAYTTLTLGWVFYFDFPKIWRYNGNGSPNNAVKHPTSELVILFTTKLFYYAYMVIFPVWYIDAPIWQTLLQMVFCHITSGFILSVVFQMAHVVEETEHPELPEAGKMEAAWMVHQLKTTANFCNHNPIISWYTGCLNFQIEHHLFPKICSVHYPAISKIVAKVAEKHQIPYHVYPSFRGAIRSHYQVLKQFSKPNATV